MASIDEVDEVDEVMALTSALAMLTGDAVRPGPRGRGRVQRLAA